MEELVKSSIAHKKSIQVLLLKYYLEHYQFFESMEDKKLLRFGRKADSRHAGNSEG